jgi:hypothetical protein
MTMDIGLASDMTCEERQEHLLGVIACAVTGRRPSEIMPWLLGDLRG